MERDQGKDVSEQADLSDEKRKSVKERLNSLLDRSKPVDIEKSQGEREPGEDQEKDIGRDTDRGKGHSL